MMKMKKTNRANEEFFQRASTGVNIGRVEESVPGDVMDHV